ERGVPSATALGVRFTTAAIVLNVLLALRRVAIVPGRSELLRLVLLGAIGYTTESTFFYLSLQHGTAAACALLFYAYPAVVCAIELTRGRERPTGPTLIALALAITGTTIVAATGADVSISATGIAFALASAAVYGVYLLVGREFGRRTDSMRAAAWLAVGAAGSSLVRGVIMGQITSPVANLGPLVLYGAFTAAAFGLTFAALSRIGAARTAVVMTLEAVTAVVLGAVLLDEHIGATQLAGGAAILLAAGTIGRRSAERSAAVPDMPE
ncbi:MAG: DMT family transporter, partial [Chloroflexi bacterium]|nr:DMT family transporter [Chloroflexota bacterium]